MRSTHRRLGHWLALPVANNYEYIVVVLYRIDNIIYISLVYDKTYLNRVNYYLQVICKIIFIASEP